MAVKVLVNSVPTTRVSIGAANRDTIRTVGVGGNVIINTGSNTLVGLSDVYASSLANNSTLVYDEASEKFVIKQLPIVNGGNF